MENNKYIKFAERPLIIVDLETTGLCPTTHDVIEIGAVKVNQETLNNESLDCEDVFEQKIKIKNKRTADKIALELNGYNKKSWEKAKKLKDAMKDFARFSANGVLVAFNITFEHSFLKESFRRAKIKDAMSFQRIDIPSIMWYNGRKRFSLDSILEEIGLPEEPKPHRALTGAWNAFQVLKYLIREKNVPIPPKV